jgi:hypothetical protein
MKIFRNLLIFAAVLSAPLLIGTAVLAATPLTETTTCPVGQQPVQDNPLAGTSESHTCCPAGTNPNDGSCFFSKYVNPLVKVLTGLVGLAVTAGIIMGGIQYAGSAGNPQKSDAGKKKITGSIYALLIFMFLYSALQFLSPAGLNGAKLSSGQTPNADNCSTEFLGLKPWFAYLPAQKFDKDCDIINFSLLGNNGQNSDLLPVALALLDDLLRIAGLVAVVFVIVGGVQYVTSQGEPDRTRQAQSSILNALIGLIVALVAAALVSFLGNRLS